MKFLIIFALANALAFANAAALESRSVVAPVLKTEGRITYGEDASVGQFPYQVGLSLQLGAYSSSWCGGSLIGNRWILTAAHCVDGAKSITVYLGATLRTAAEVTYNVNKSDIIIHSGWRSINLKDDIALIKIPSVTYTSTIQAVKIPAVASSYTNYVGDYVIASGWGRLGDYILDKPNNLRWTRLQVITNSKCTSAYTFLFVSSSKICTSTTDGATCQGDSGGPLVLASNNVQIGLTSFGSAKGCDSGDPVVFTRLTSYLDWIKTKTGISY